MTDVPAPRARPRPVVAPAPRSRIRPATDAPYQPNIPTPAPRARTRVIIPNALELPPLMKAHNRIDVLTGEEPDPRFAPMVIVPKSAYLKTIHPLTKMRADEALKYTVDTIFVPDDLSNVVNNYLTEIGLRRYCGKKMLTDGVMLMLEEFIVDQHEHMNGCQRSMITIDWEDENTASGVSVDLTKASGPYYCDGIVSLDANYSKYLKPFTKPGAK